MREKKHERKRKREDKKGEITKIKKILVKYYLQEEGECFLAYSFYIHY